MGQDSRIGWTHHTFNHVRGCLKISPGCEHCYAAEMSARNPAVLGRWGPEATGTRVVAAESYWRQPLRWDREARAAGERRRVFCASLADVFEDWRGPMVDSRGRVLHYNSAATWWVPEPTMHGPVPMRFVRERLATLILCCEHLDFLLLTKRPEDARRMLAEMFGASAIPDGMYPGLPRNLWLGVTAEDQRRADERIPVLLSIPAAVRFVSAEPLLGMVDLTGAHHGGYTWNYLDAEQWSAAHARRFSGLDWVIVGGESGPRRRPMELDWLRSIVDQCRDAGVPVYVKQDAAPRDSQQGRIPADLWAIKEFPRVATTTATEDHARS